MFLKVGNSTETRRDPTEEFLESLSIVENHSAVVGRTCFSKVFTPVLPHTAPNTGWPVHAHSCPHSHVHPTSEKFSFEMSVAQFSQHLQEDPEIIVLLIKKKKKKKQEESLLLKNDT